MKKTSFLIILLMTYSCKPIMRYMFYPPEVDMSATMTGDIEGKSFDHTVFTKLLNKYVSAKDGQVNYSGFAKEDKALDKYILSLSRQNLAELSLYARLAFLINAYNAFTIKLMLNHALANSIKDIAKAKRWQAKIWLLDNKKVSLNEIEHQLIRKNFPEPRIHFALVCASKSCPPLLNVAYRRELLMKQLQEQTKRFFANKENFHIDKNHKNLYLSSILDWYEKDFISHYGSLTKFIQKYATSQFTDNENLRIQFLEYDWSLNGSREA